MFPAAATIKSANRRAPTCDTRARRNTAKRPRIGIGMAETTEKTGEKKLSVAPSKTLSLKGRGVEQGVVRQSFSHGRTKSVVVEKVKSRTVPGKPRVEVPAPKASPAAPAVSQPASKPSGVVLRTLTDEEQKARVHALADARLRDAEER